MRDIEGRKMTLADWNSLNTETRGYLVSMYRSFLKEKQTNPALVYRGIPGGE